MLEVLVQDNQHENNLLRPLDMFTFPEGTVFQQYFNGQPQKCYYVNIGINESLLNIWFNEETSTYCLSTDDKDSIKQLVRTVETKVIKAKVRVKLEANGE